MTEYELDKLCERNPNCDCPCREKMSKMSRLLAALIIVAILSLAFFISGLITKLLMLLPSPWCHIAIVSYLAVVLVGGIYVILGEIEQEKDNHVKLD